MGSSCSGSSALCWAFFGVSFGWFTWLTHTHTVSAEFGTVLELRINSGGKLPNFGFVVFDDSEPVQKILSSRVRLASGSKVLFSRRLQTRR